MIRCLFALCVLLAFVVVSLCILAASPWFLPFLFGSLVVLALFVLGVFVLGWTLFVVFPVLLSGLLAWMLFWLFFP